MPCQEGFYHFADCSLILSPEPSFQLLSWKHSCLNACYVIFFGINKSNTISCVTSQRPRPSLNFRSLLVGLQISVLVSGVCAAHTARRRAFRTIGYSVPLGKGSGAGDREESRNLLDTLLLCTCAVLSGIRVCVGLRLQS